MSAPIPALQEAIRAVLLADAGVMALLREPKIFADPPRHAAFPHAAFVSSVARENGTSTDEGHASELGLAVWCRGRSAEGFAVADAMARALAAAPPAPAGHRLVNLVVLSTEAQALKDGETWRVLLRIRAVTEVL